MKQLLEDYWGKPIYEWEWYQYVDCETKGGDYGSSTYIEGDAKQPQIRFYDNQSKRSFNTVNLSDLLVFIYNNKK